MTSQSTIAKFLDSAASRADMIGATPATRKQCWFLAKLIIDNDDDCTRSEVICNTSMVLTKSKASNMISLYLN